MAVSSLASPRCDHHPRIRAGWFCAGCERYLCPDCVARVAANERVSYDTCVRCDGSLEVLTQPAPVASFRSLMNSFWLIPVERNTGVGFVGGVAWAYLSCVGDNLASPHFLGAFSLEASLAAVATGVAFALMVRTARSPDDAFTQASVALTEDVLRPGWLFFLVSTGVLTLPALLGRNPSFAPHEHIWNGVALLSSMALAGAWTLGSVYAGGRSGRRVGSVGTLLKNSSARSAFVLSAVLGGLMHVMFWTGVAMTSIEVSLHAVLLRAGVVLTALVSVQMQGVLLHVVAPLLGFPLPERFKAPLLDTPPLGLAPARAPDARPRDR